MDVKTFTNLPLQNILKNYIVVKFNISNMDSQQENFLKELKLYGPPALIVFDKNKNIKYKLLGFVSSEDLINKLS